MQFPLFYIFLLSNFTLGNMKFTFSKLFIVAFFLVAIACTKTKQDKIIVYGSSNCHHCTDFIAQLDSANMSYEFRDFMVSEQQYTQELMYLLDSINYRDYVNFPVVKVANQVFIEAKFDEVKEAAYN